jgi:hypothetical protein
MERTLQINLLPPQEGQPMQTEQLSDAKTYRVAAVAGIAAIIASSLTALTVIFLLRWRRQTRAEKRDELQVEQVPTQPAFNTSAPVRMPNHFTENLVVPGVTHTGSEIAQHDDLEGRSPEGV